MDDLIVFIIFIIVSIFSYFSKKKEEMQRREQASGEPDLGQPWLEIPPAPAMPRRAPFESYSDPEPESAVEEDEGASQTIALEEPLTPHETPIIASSLKDAFRAQSPETSPGAPSLLHRDHAISPATAAVRAAVRSKQSLRTAFILREILDRPRAYDI